MPNTLHLKFSRPGRASIAGEDIFVAVYNPDGLDLDIVFISSTVDQTGAKKVVRHSTQWTGNPTVIKTRTFPDGPFQIVARTKGDGPQIRSNSITGQIYPDTEPNRLWVAQDRVAEHRMDSAIRTSSKSVLTLTNPWVRPGRSLPMEGTKWFPTAVYEGATSLYNETRAYYEDPLAYFVAQILRLKKKGLTFVTWHDVLDDPERDYSSAVLLQFDLDAGPRSFRRIADILIKAGIRATGMIHWRARHWYDYDFESDDIAALQEIEKAGWAFGYHHNCLTTLVGPSEDRLNTPDIKQQAQAMMRDEIAQLRQHLNIRTLTHHGGNVVNASVEIPQDIDIVPVDRPINPEPWAQVSTSFSDGSFTSRPSALAYWVDQQQTGTGLRFMRCHPVKYGNYDGEADVPELMTAPSDLPPVADVKAKVDAGYVLTPLDKQVAWIALREKSRDGIPLAEYGAEMPLSAHFTQSLEMENMIQKFRARRRPGFLRQYPWQDGDPRVLWWRVLSTYCPKGRVLNVGAMPPDQKDETIAFAPQAEQIIEFDIDPDRQPDILGDFCAPDYEPPELFDCVLLNGLPYYSDPASAITNAWRTLKDGGTLLVGAAGATQAERGGVFRPDDRPVWAKGRAKEGGASLSLLTTLWSFDAPSIDDLMAEWRGPFEAEALAHYWFIVARKQAT